MMDLNHDQWLETVPAELLPFVEKAIQDWNDQADEANQWASLGWDERDALLLEAAADNEKRLNRIIDAANRVKSGEAKMIDITDWTDEQIRAHLNECLEKRNGQS
jgi:hypothetical protein